MIDFKKATVLITGGTGSFGVAFLESLLKKQTKEIRIFSRDEKKQFDLKRSFPQANIRWFIGDVRDRESLRDAVRGVDFIFHAAALKQVPTLENFPVEATKTNVIGTDNVLSLAIDYQVQRVIVLSTDKSIQPLSVMGMSKSLMEKVALAKALITTKPIINIVRYGNVIGSRGSVVPLFVEAMNHQEPFHIHQLHATRFMISMKEAIQLVYTAAEVGKPGEIFIPKVKSAPLSLLVKALEILLKKHAIYEEKPLRPGDKLHEQIIDHDEYPYTFEKDAYLVIDGLRQLINPHPIEAFTSESKVMTIEELIEVLRSQIYS
ncbi:MAG: polysaccharide biosynthesis protein [Bacilli bacterium]